MWREVLVDRLNSLAASHPAELRVIPEMFHGPGRRAQYESVFRALSETLDRNAAH